MLIPPAVTVTVLRTWLGRGSIWKTLSWLMDRFLESLSLLLAPLPSPKPPYSSSSSSCRAWPRQE